MKTCHRLTKSQPCGMHLFASCALCGTRKKIKHEDLTLVLRYTNTSELDIRQEPAATVRHLREAKGLKRREVSRRSGFSVRWLIALERACIPDLSLPEFDRLSNGLGLDAMGLMHELEKRLNF